MTYFVWYTVRAQRDIRIFGRFPHTTRLSDEHSNYRQGTTLVIGVPEHLSFNGEERSACRVLKKDDMVVEIVSYVLVSDFGDKNLLQAAVQRLKKK